MSVDVRDGQSNAPGRFTGSTPLRAVALVVGTAIVLAGSLTAIAGPSASARTPTCHGHRATIVGTNRAEAIHGTAGADVIVARGGRDTIFGRGGRDIICGGRGKDRIRGGARGDQIFGGSGHDVINGGRGDDEVHGGAGDDVLFGARGNDELRGGRGNDDLDGGAGPTDLCVQGSGTGMIVRCAYEAVADLWISIALAGPANRVSATYEYAPVTVTLTAHNGGPDAAPSVRVWMTFEPRISAGGEVCKVTDIKSDPDARGTFTAHTSRVSEWTFDCSNPYAPGPYTAVAHVSGPVLDAWSLNDRARLTLDLEPT